MSTLKRTRKSKTVLSEDEKNSFDSINQNIVQTLKPIKEKQLEKKFMLFSNESLTIDEFGISCHCCKIQSDILQHIPSKRNQNSDWVLDEKTVRTITNNYYNNSKQQQDILVPEILRFIFVAVQRGENGYDLWNKIQQVQFKNDRRISFAIPKVTKTALNTIFDNSRVPFTATELERLMNKEISLYSPRRIDLWNKNTNNNNDNRIHSIPPPVPIHYGYTPSHSHNYTPYGSNRYSYKTLVNHYHPFQVVSRIDNNYYNQCLSTDNHIQYGFHQPVNQFYDGAGIPHEDIHFVPNDEVLDINDGVHVQGRPLLQEPKWSQIDVETVQSINSNNYHQHQSQSVFPFDFNGYNQSISSSNSNFFSGSLF